MTQRHERGNAPDPERLAFRRQFILGPRYFEAGPSWQRLSIGPALKLTVHPDLGVHQSVAGEKSVTLLGYILDPLDTEAGDGAIVDRLLRALAPGGSFEDVLQLCDPLGGRWVLVVDDGNRVRLFTDPCGYRQVFFTTPGLQGGPWCGSQSGIIAEAAGLVPDVEASAFIEAYEGRGPGAWPSQEYFWPGDRSPYREVKHLIPNHILDLTDGSSRRFWPRDVSGATLSVDEAVHTSAGLLTGLITSASKRFPLALSMTAGRDTRLLLAASRGISRQLYYFTLASFWHITETSPDVRIPAELLGRLGLTHHVLHCPPAMSAGFERIYRRNVSTAHPAYGLLAEALFRAYPAERVCMKGNAIPIARARYALDGMTRREATPAALAKAFAVEGNPFAISAFGDWLDGAGDTGPIPIMDLFYWENIEGSWQAMSQSEWDIAQEVFVPYNCRALLASSLAVAEKYRSAPRYPFFERLMASLWPDVLSVPINPHDPHGERVTLRSRVRRALIKTGLYGLVPDRLKSVGRPH